MQSVYPSIFTKYIVILIALLASMWFWYASDSYLSKIWGVSGVAAAALMLLFAPGRLFTFFTYLALSSSIVFTVVIVSLLFKDAVDFFSKVPVLDFLLGTNWNPNGTMIDGKFRKIFGIIPLISGTLVVTVIATVVAAPLGILSAIYMSHFAKKSRNVSKTIVEILAGIPSVIYGYFAFSVFAPLLTSFGSRLGVNIALESALSAGIVMGIMIMPLVISTVDDVLSTVPKNLYYGALVLGATRAEALLKVVIPAALPGIASAVMLAITRAIGETVIVLMATGTAAKLTLNPLEPISTINVQIATLLTGDQNSGDIETLSAYTLGLMLFIITWIFNTVALTVINRYTPRYH